MVGQEKVGSGVPHCIPFFTFCPPLPHTLLVPTIALPGLASMTESNNGVAALLHLLVAAQQWKPFLLSKCPLLDSPFFSWIGKLVITNLQLVSEVCFHSSVITQDPGH